MSENKEDDLVKLPMATPEKAPEARKKHLGVRRISMGSYTPDRAIMDDHAEKCRSDPPRLTPKP